MKFITTLIFAPLLIVGSLAGVSASEFKAGEHYEVTSIKGSDQPVVEEFFNYACAACYSFETFITQFKSKHPTVEVKYVPVELNPAWKIYVKAFYIGEKLGVLSQSHPKLFHRLHVEKRPFRGEEDMKAFFLELGVEAKAYDDIAKSYWLNTQLRMAKQYAFKHKVMSTPTLVINQQYKLNIPAIGGDKLEAAVIEISGAKSE